MKVLNRKIFLRHLLPGFRLCVCPENREGRVDEGLDFGHVVDDDGTDAGGARASRHGRRRTNQIRTRQV